VFDGNGPERPLFAVYTARSVNVARTEFASEDLDGFSVLESYNGAFQEEDFSANVLWRD
jgi:hypothetical protein